MMLTALLLLAQLASTQPATLPFDDPDLIPTTVKLDEEREATILRAPDGRPIRAVVRRMDGQPMTCASYFAWFAQTYTCTGSCSSSYPIYGGEGGSSRLAACEAARAEVCNYATSSCGGGSYGFCNLIESESGRWDPNLGNCTYVEIRSCVVADDCLVE
jgi:hypothetical protein